jgi:hypothetical protein
MAWLLHDDNAGRLSREALDCWRQAGRGFWFVSHTSEVRMGDDAIQPAHYLPQSSIPKLPECPARRDVQRLVRRYDPARQFVLVIEEPDGISAYRLMFADGAA